MRFSPFLAAVILVLATAAAAQETYKTPPQDVVDILDAPPLPATVPSPARDAVLLVEYDAYPSIELLSRPFLKLAGLRVDPVLGSRQRTRQFTGIQILDLAGGSTRRVDLPAGSRLGFPAWSHDGRRIAFTRDVGDGVELWVADAASGRAQALGSVRVNDILGSPFEWTSDNRSLLVRRVSPVRGAAPQAHRVPVGPNVQETAGKRSQAPTFQDLLADPHDEALFEHYATSELALVDAETGAVSVLGAPGIYLEAEFSPSDAYLLVTRLERPFSFRVPYYYFTRRTEVWTASGENLHTLAALPVSDEVPRQGVPTGPRSVQWQPLVAATLVWTEALDGGDPLAKVPHREQLRSLAAPFTGEPRDVVRLKQRYQGTMWTARAGQVLVAEYDRDRRWRTTSFFDMAAPERTWRTVFDLSVNDAYNDPGNPVWTTRPDGQSTLLHDGDWIYLAGRGATEKGDRPFLDRMNLKTLRKERLFLSSDTSYESFVTFAGDSRRRIVTNHQTPKDPPNLYRVDLGGKKRQALTHFPDPAPQLTGLEKKLLQYHRKDGVALSGVLYLPPGHRPGTRLPVVVWAYPLEYSDAGTAGQVRGSDQTFTRLAGTSPLFFLTQGYAVLNDATMPVIGDPETMNDTYVEQIVAAAEAAIDTLDAMGVADRDRCVIAGHSYGAFMTANLLAHSDLFAAGIARSGAYNRSLTPFGFQAERRSFWEATDIYTRISPFSFAHRIDEPLLLIHGEEDNNSGTFPLQSERLFQALQGNGGTARLVMLPHESHGYQARESVLHVLAEMFEWADRYAKNGQATTDRR